MPRTVQRLAGTLLALGASHLAAQDLPPYVPVNPVLTSRSPLYAQPFIPMHRGWLARTVMDYTNAVEVDENNDGRHYTFDAEVLEADFWLTRDISRHLFVVGDVPLRGGYSGFLDQALNWYHDLIGLPVPARKTDPRNTFIWDFTLPDGRHIVRPRPGTFLGDVRIGVGARRHRGQVSAMVTLPTTTTDDAGWGRGVVSASLAASENLVRTSRVVVDAGVSAGVTPTHGALASYQRTAFAGGFLGGRWRFLGNQAAFATVWVQSSNWKNTGFDALDGTEATLDFGFLLKVTPRAPELQLGLTEDLYPRGPAVDVGFKIGVRW
jgi:hypothetical protein